MLYNKISLGKREGNGDWYWDSKLLNWFCKLFHQNLIFHILFHYHFQIGQTHPESPNNTPHIPAGGHPFQTPPAPFNHLTTLQDLTPVLPSSQFVGIFLSFEQLYSMPCLFVQVGYRTSQEGRNHPSTSFVPHSSKNTTLQRRNSLNMWLTEIQCLPALQSFQIIPLKVIGSLQRKLPSRKSQVVSGNRLTVDNEIWIKKSTHLFKKLFRMARQAHIILWTSMLFYLPLKKGLLW